MALSHINGIALSGLSHIDGIAKSGLSAINGQTIGGGGGSPAWHDQLSDPTLATASGDPSSSSRFGKVTPTVSGTCSALRIYIDDTNTGAYDLKMVLTDTSGALLASGTAVGSVSDGTNRYYSVTLTAPVAVTNGTEYRIGFRASSSIWGHHFAYGSQPSGSGYTSTLSYAALDGGGSAAPFTATTSIYPVGMYITP
jgi:hypothetical protein